MGLEVRRVREAIHKFRPSQPFFHDAKIVEERGGRATLVTYWKNPELAGIWELRYRIIPKCMIRLQYLKLIEHDGPSERGTQQYKLSKRGRKRLG